MEITNYKPEQTVFQVAINISNNTATITPQKIIYVGNTTLYVVGESAEWGLHHGEHTLSVHSFEILDRKEVLKSSTCNLWTDTMEKAEEFKAQIDNILKIKDELLTA